MRERLLSENGNQLSVAQSLAGLDSDRAWEMRELLLNEGVGQSSVAMGLVGYYITFVWCLRRKSM